MPMNSGRDYVAREVEVAQPLMAAGPVGGNQGGDFIVHPILEAGARPGASTTDIRAGLGIGKDGDAMFTLQAGKQHAVAVALRGRDGGATAELGGEQAFALRASGGGGSDPYVLAPTEPLPFDTTQITSPTNRNSPKHGDPCHPLAAAHPPAIAFSCKDSGQDASVDLSPTMRAMGHASSHPNAGGQIAVCVTGEITHTLKADGFDGSEDGSEDGSGRGQPVIAFHTQQDPISSSSSLPLAAKDRGNGLLVNMAVRRLMPVECERLQGFPDDYTKVPVGKKLAADGPRYKQLGNSWAVKHARWVGSRLAAELARLDAEDAVGNPDGADSEISLLVWTLAA